LTIWITCQKTKVYEVGLGIPGWIRRQDGLRGKLVANSRLGQTPRRFLCCQSRVTKILQNEKGEVIGAEAVTNKEADCHFQSEKSGHIWLQVVSHTILPLCCTFSAVHTFGGCAAPDEHGRLRLHGQRHRRPAWATWLERSVRKSFWSGRSVIRAASTMSSMFWATAFLEVNRYGLRIMDEKAQL